MLKQINDLWGSSSVFVFPVVIAEGSGLWKDAKFSFQKILLDV